MRKWLIGALALPGLLCAQQEAPEARIVTLRVQYQPKSYSRLLGMTGFGREGLEMHFKLYQGYVTNANQMLTLLEQLTAAGKLGSIEWAGVKRRFGWEWDGMRLHEYYFDALGGDGVIDKTSSLYRAIVGQWGSFEAWRKDFE